MSTIVARGAQVIRPAAVSVAVLLTVILNVLGLPLFLLLADEAPASVIVFGIVASVGTLVGAWGLWQLRRWGAILTFVLTLLNLLSSLPGFVFADDGWTLALLIVTTPPQIAVLVLIALRSSRRAYR